MKKVDFLIVGGSAAGTTAAEVIRSLKPEATITIVNDEKHEEYSRVLLPQYVSHKVTLEQLFLKKPEWYQDKRIELIKGVRAQRLEVSRKVVTLDGGEQYEFGKLLIAIGGNVARLSVPGSDSPRIIYLRTLEDADNLIAVAKSSRRAVVVGGGFVSLDFAEGFRANGIEEVTILVREPYYWASRLDKDSSGIMTQVLEQNNVKVVSGEEVQEFKIADGVLEIVTKSGKTMTADAVGVGIGIKSDFRWLEASGVKIDRGILTNEYLETSIADIYAAGDCAQFQDVIFNRSHVMGNWSNATSQGAAVGKTMAGVRTVFETASSYSDTFFEGSYSFIGVTDEKYADEVISRGSVESKKMTRIFIKSTECVVRIVGASVINNPAEISPLTGLVKNKIDILEKKEELRNVEFDLKRLI